MVEERFHVGNAAGFATDRVDAGAPVVRALIESGAPSALFYETLAERTLAYAQRNKLRDADKGYTPDLERFLAPVLADCVAHKIPILGNFGAANPAGAARAIHRLAQELGIEEIKVAVVEGDDVREGLRSMQVQAWEEEPLFDVGRHDIVAANAYLGARPIADALALVDKPLHALVVYCLIVQAIALTGGRRYKGTVTACVHARMQLLAHIGRQRVHGVVMAAVQIGQQRTVEIDDGQREIDAAQDLAHGRRAARRRNAKLQSVCDESVEMGLAVFGQRAVGLQQGAVQVGYVEWRCRHGCVGALVAADGVHFICAEKCVEPAPTPAACAALRLV